LSDGARVQGARRVRRFLVSTAVVIVVVVGVVVALGFTSSAPQRAPAFSYPRLGGGAPVRYPLAGSQAHHPLVVAFFASWCSPCRTDLPTIARVARQEARRRGPVEFVGIDGNDEPASGLAFARQSGVMFPVGSDAESALAPRFGLDGYPDTVFVDASGDVAYVVHGPVSRATLERWVARLAAT
jgi:cytochrome c biogenesis protein CcmG, thiol:disulfide interchange protein DsbE